MTADANRQANVRRFLATKVIALTARSRRLTQLTPGRVGLRPKDLPFAPSDAHFSAADRRLRIIDQAIERRLSFLNRNWRRASPQRALVYMAMLEREVDRARRAFGMFFEVFSQRGSDFAPALAAHDMIAADCYAVIRRAEPLVFRGALLKPVTYMEHGYSPSTNRRGVTLRRLLGERNPFPLIRIPWDRDNPWQAVFLHECSHNLQADLGIWQENQDAVTRRLLRMKSVPLVTTIYRRWHKEIFADLSACLLGGTASAWGMLEFLAHPGARALTYTPGGAHPTGYIRGLILTEMLRRMGFPADAARVNQVWSTLYNPRRGHRLPPQLIGTASRIVPAIVDEIAYQPRRNLGQQTLADLIPYTRSDEAAIRRGAMLLARGRVPADLPPRFFVSASRFALELGAPAKSISDLVVRHLAERATRERGRPLVGNQQAAA